METVNVNGEPNDSGGRLMTEKRILPPHTITLPPSKTCTTGARSESLRVSLVEDNPTAGVLREGAVCNNMSWVVAEGAKLVQTEVRGVTEAVAKRTVVLSTAILGVTWGVLTTVGAFVLRAINTKMPCEVTVKTTSLISHQGLWAQMGISRCNSSGIRGGYIPDERQDGGRQGHLVRWW